jgi:hypothetical protein
VAGRRAARDAEARRTHAFGCASRARRRPRTGPFCAHRHGRQDFSREPRNFSWEFLGPRERGFCPGVRGRWAAILGNPQLGEAPEGRQACKTQSSCAFRWSLPRIPGFFPGKSWDPATDPDPDPDLRPGPRPPTRTPTKVTQRKIAKRRPDARRAGPKSFPGRLRRQVSECACVSLGSEGGWAGKALAEERNPRRSARPRSVVLRLEATRGDQGRSPVRHGRVLPGDEIPRASRRPLAPRAQSVRRSSQRRRAASNSQRRRRSADRARRREDHRTRR